MSQPNAVTASYRVGSLPCTSQLVEWGRMPQKTQGP